MSNFSGFDSTPQSITMRSLAHNFTLEERHRRDEAQLNKDFYYGTQEHTLALMNDDVEPIIMNITKPILTKRCDMLYQRPLKREFEGSAASIAYLERVYYENSIDTLLKRVDLLSELTGSCLVHPKFDEAMPSGIRLVTYDGTQFTGIGREDDPMIPEAVSLIRLVDTLDKESTVHDHSMPQIERNLWQQIWTPEAISLYMGDLEPALIKTEPNELGFLPFVNFLGEELPDGFVGHPPATLVRKANHHINSLLTHLGFMIKMQSHTPIVLQGFKHGESVVIHPGRAVNVPMETAVTTLSLNPKIADTLATIQFLEDRLYTCSSVPRISVEGGEGTSGRELMIRWHPLLGVFQEKTTRYNAYELKLANMILSVVGLEPIEQVNIEWPSEEIMPLSAEEEMLERDIALNLKTPIDEIMRRNPELTEEEAQIELLTNMTINENSLTIQGE